MLVMACTPPVELNLVRIISLNHAVLITFEARPGREAKLCEEYNRYFGIGRGKVFHWNTKCGIPFRVREICKWHAGPQM